MATLGKPFDYFTVNDIGNTISADIEVDQKKRGNWLDLVRNGFVIEKETPVLNINEVGTVLSVEITVDSSEDMTKDELYDLAKSKGLKVSKRMKRETLIKKLSE